jgi:hypothetical protein
VTLGIVLPLLLLSSCAADVSIRPLPLPEATVAVQKQPARPIEAAIYPLPPADVTINQDAGHGGLLVVTLRLASGEALPFIVDTGAPARVGVMEGCEVRSFLRKPERNPQKWQKLAVDVPAWLCLFWLHVR